jgi:DNA-binding MarR family transcriptional regulator
LNNNLEPVSQSAPGGGKDTGVNERDWRILAEIEAGPSRSQRSVARKTGIALGLTNLILRRMVRQGLVRLIHVKRNRVLYLITPAGIAEKARLSRAYLVRNARFYAQTRDRVRGSFAALSAACQRHTGCEKRIVFFGAGDIGEIAYVCLRDSDLKLVGVVGDRDERRFFGFPVYPLSSLKGLELDGQAFDHLVVTDLDTADGLSQVSRQLEERGLPSDRVFWL